MKPRIKTTINRRQTELGYCDTDVAYACRIAQPHYNRIKNGITQPGVLSAIKIARALGTTVEDLWQ